MSDHGSRKSATHGRSGNAFFTPRAIKCVEWGGPVETTASTGQRASSFFSRRTDGRIQSIRESGMKTLPRTHCIHVAPPPDVPPEDAPRRSWGLPPLSRSSHAAGSTIRPRHTVVVGSTSASSWGSVKGYAAPSGTYTMGCQPFSGRYLVNFSHRWTPPPPEGGQ